jgi:DNA-binding winged helix-turn-helix (wHTH) protein
MMPVVVVEDTLFWQALIRPLLNPAETPLLDACSFPPAPHTAPPVLLLDTRTPATRHQARALQARYPDCKTILLGDPPCTPAQDLRLDCWLPRSVSPEVLAALIQGYAREHLSHHTPSPCQESAGVWEIHVPQLEVRAPNGKHISLSHNELRLLEAARDAHGTLISRKTLIEALGHDYWEYDERRLEALISRLRRKLSAQAGTAFLVRGIKGQGYVFSSLLHTQAHPLSGTGFHILSPLKAGSASLRPNATSVF